MDGEERAQWGGGLAASLLPQCPQHAPGVSCGPRGSPSSLLDTPPPPLLASSLQACPPLPRTPLEEAPGRDLSLGHLPRYPWDSGQPNQLTPAEHVPSHKSHAEATREMRRVSPPAAGEGKVRTSAADGLSLLVDQEQDEGQAEDAHDAGARRQRGGCDICNRREQSWSGQWGGFALRFSSSRSRAQGNTGVAPRLMRCGSGTHGRSAPRGICAGMPCRLRT